MVRAVAVCRFALMMGLTACTANLILPEETQIVCVDDGDCPSPRTCEVAIKRCVDVGLVDEEPPTLIAATASDSTHVVLELSEVIDPRTSDITRYALTPTLTVEDAEVATSYRQVRLTVDPQEPGRDYVVRVSGIADVAGNAIADGAQISFIGFGAAPDRNPPEIIAPLDAEVRREASVTLVWTRRAYAEQYEVEVAYDAAFTQPVAGFPLSVVDPQTSLTYDFPAEVRYYWRVRATSTRQGEYGIGMFDRLGAVMHVYCPAGDSCSDDGAAGNVSAPFRTLVGAVARARASGIHTFRVAARGGGAAYAEHVTIGFGVELRGGYTPTFDEASRDPAVNVTNIAASAGPALLVFGVSEPIVIDGFFLRSVADDALRVNGGSDVTISNNDVAGAESAIAVENSVLDTDQNLIVGNVIHSLTPQSGHGIVVRSAGATIRDNVIDISACTSACKDAAGIATNAADVLVTGNVITHGGQLGLTNGIELIESHFDIRANRVTMGNGATNAVKTTAVFSIQPPSVIANNILLGGTTSIAGSHFSTALDVQSFFTVLVSNNVLYGGSGAGMARTILDASGQVTETSYTNNIIFNGDATPSYCFYETDTARPTFFRANLLFGCADALYRNYNSTTGETLLTSIALVNQAANTTQGAASTAGGNLTLASLADVGFVAFPSDLHLTAATPVAVRRSGVNTAQNLCGTSSNLGCGDVVDDYDGAGRTCPTPGSVCYSLGAYERDQ